MDGAMVGDSDGDCEGATEGPTVGDNVGDCVGDVVGPVVGEAEGCTVGAADGAADGIDVGARLTHPTNPPLAYVSSMLLRCPTAAVHSASEATPKDKSWVDPSPTQPMLAWMRASSLVNSKRSAESSSLRCPHSVDPDSTAKSSDWPEDAQSTAVVDAEQSCTIELTRPLWCEHWLTLGELIKKLLVP